MTQLALKPTHAAVKNYYAALHQARSQLLFRATRPRSADAFAKLLADCGRKLHLTFIPQFPDPARQDPRHRRRCSRRLLYHLPARLLGGQGRKRRLAERSPAQARQGLPRDNTIFQAPERAILYQGGTRIFDENISRPEALVSVVNQFFDYKAPHIEEWLKAVDEFFQARPGTICSSREA